ncbi:MAG: ribonuclease HII [Candidatus Schekmanbacteria bacterium]|nr:ribonuclease HII [Candidatus Schekmanbacteria bacterium]
MDLFEKEGFCKGFRFIAGIDEAGRGPLAGPVHAAAVILPADHRIEGLNDSKKLSSSKRDYLFNKIIGTALSYSISEVDEKIIDEINILQASKLAMEKAVKGLNQIPDYLLIDGIVAIDSSIPQKTIIKGDAQSYSIAAASILAKVTRDKFMMEMHTLYPQYGFDRHKGYPTKEHIMKIMEIGPCEIHRKTFKQVKNFKVF